MEHSIWIAAWQLQCCGPPFGVGSEVGWPVLPADAEWLAVVLGPERSATVGFAREDHHDGAEPLPRVAGTVTAVEVVRCAYGSIDGSRDLYPIEGSGTVEPVDRADGSEPDQGTSRLAGYLVEVDGEVLEAPPAPRRVRRGIFSRRL